MFVLVFICFGHCARDTCGHVPAQEGPDLTLGLHLRPCCHHLGHFSVPQKHHILFALDILESSPSDRHILLSLFSSPPSPSLLSSALTYWLCYRVQAHTAHCTTGQYIKRRAIEARNSDFIWKASRPRRWWTSFPKNHLPQVRIQAPFIVKGEGVRLVVVNFLVSESFVPTAVHVGQVMMPL